MRILLLAVLLVPLVSNTLLAEDFVPPKTSSSRAADFDVLFSKRLNINPGVTYWRDTLKRGINDAERIWLYSPDCQGIKAWLRLRENSRSSYTVAHFEKGDPYWYVPAEISTATSFEIEFHQPTNGPVTCTVRMEARFNPNPPLPPRMPPVRITEELVGNFRYDGGLVVGRPIKVTTEKRIVGFRLAIPEICKDVSVIRAGVLNTEGEFVKLEPADTKTQTYALSRSVAEKVQEIRATIDGPESLECLIPVYLRVR